MPNSKFDKLAKEIAAEYRAKGYSPAESMKIGKESAAKIGRKKYGKKGMARKSSAGRRKKAKK